MAARRASSLQHFAEITTSLAKLEQRITDNDPELASYLWIEERELEAGGLN